MAAVLSKSPSSPSARQYPSHPLALVILAHPLRADDGPARYFPTEIWLEDEALLRPGDRVLVTDERADQYKTPDSNSSPWSGG